MAEQGALPQRKPFSATARGRHLAKQQHQRAAAGQHAAHSTGTAVEAPSMLGVQGQAAQLHGRHPQQASHWGVHLQQHYQPPAGYWQPGQFAHLMQHADPNQLMAAYIAAMQSMAASPAGEL